MTNLELLAMSASFETEVFNENNGKRICYYLNSSTSTQYIFENDCGHHRLIIFEGGKDMISDEFISNPDDLLKYSDIIFQDFAFYKDRIWDVVSFRKSYITTSNPYRSTNQNLDDEIITQIGKWLAAN